MKRLLLILILISYSAYAEVPFTIEADTFETPEESVYHAKGNVKVFQGDKTLLADEIYYYKDKNSIHAFDNVKLMEPGKNITCDEMEFNADDQSGTFINASAFMEPYHWFSASKLDRHNEYSYGMEDARYTTCSGENPDWAFKAKQADLTVGGYLTSKHTTGRIKDIPVFYTPYFIYPVKTERESGLLIPEFGMNGDAGVYLIPKFFWNIDVDQDATFGVVAASKQSPLYIVEHRYTPSSRENMYTYAEYINQERTHPDAGAAGVENDSKSGRFLLYNEGNLDLSDDLSFYSYIKTFSDSDYVDDFDKYSPLDEFEEKNDIYNSSLSLIYRTTYTDLYLRYIDELEYSDSSHYIKEHTYYKPSLTLYKNITTTPIYLSYNINYSDIRYTKYAYLESNNTKSVTDYSYKREHLSFKFYRPFNLYVATFTPSIELLKTRWHDMDNSLADIQEYRNSTYSKLRVNDDEAYRDTYIFRHTLAFNEIYKNYEHFKHSIYNTFTYSQSPYIDETSIPDIASYDRIEQVRNYRYKLENFFTGSDWRLILGNTYVYNQINEADDNDTHIGEIHFSYKNFWANMKHEFDLVDHDDEYFYSKVAYNYAPFEVSAYYEFDKEEYTGASGDKNTSANFTLKYVSDRYDIGYTREISGRNPVMTTANMSDISDSIDITYKSECWNFTVTLEKETDPSDDDYTKKGDTNYSIMFMFSLKGLGASDHGYRGSRDYLDNKDNEDEI
ncbi:MAG: LPS-assembly protein LptD [Deferribacterales bacterium]